MGFFKKYYDIGEIFLELKNVYEDISEILRDNMFFLSRLIS